MHMRKKHSEGTKQDMERDRGIRVRDTLLFTENEESDWESGPSFLRS